MSSIFYGVSIGLIIAIVLSIILGLFLFFVQVTPSIVDSIYVIIGYLSTGIGAMFAGAKAGTKGWIFGGGCGLAYMVILYLGATWLFAIPPVASVFLIRAGTGVAVGMLGGILGVNVYS